MKRGIKKITSVLLSGKFLPITLMMFLLSVLTVGNAFLYGQHETDQCVLCATANADDEDSNTCKSPVGSEEEKSSKSPSTNLAEEYLHSHDLFLHLYTIITADVNTHLYQHGFGDDHSRLHSPPPDFMRFIS